MRYRFGPPADFDDDFAGIVARTKDLHKITRSTVPLLAWWGENAPAELSPGVDLSQATARFEYAVPSGCATCGGKGKSSMTDVMVLVDNTATAVEGKYTEARYETVGVWRKKGKSTQNRECVLAHWCHLIEDFTGTKIEQAQLGGIVYQTLHRTASACAAAPRGGNAEVLYLVFGEKASSSDYTSDLIAAARVLDPGKRIRFTLLSVPTLHGRDHDDIAQLVNAATNDEERVEILAEALTSKREIYRFEAAVRTSIQ